MINVYNSTETTFNHNGICVLIDCVKAEISEELNGLFELEVVHTIDSRGKWQNLIEGNILKADGQLFRIYRKKKTTDGLRVMVNARHISYDLINNFLENVQITNSNGSQALNQIFTNTEYAHPFMSYSNVSTISTVSLIRKNPIESIFDDDGILGRWGGELERDNFLIKLLAQRGADSGVLITYGKNLVGIEEELDFDSVVTSVYPVGSNGITLPEKFANSIIVNHYPFPRIKTIEFSEAATVTELRTKAQNYINSGVDVPVANYKVNFVELSKTEQYKDFAILQRVHIGDTVTVRHKLLGIDIKARAISYIKDVLSDRYLQIELGSFKKNSYNTTNQVISAVQEVSKQIATTKDYQPKVYIAKMMDNTGAIITPSTDWQRGNNISGKIFTMALSVDIPSESAGYYHSVNDIELPEWSTVDLKNIAGISIETLNHEMSASVVNPTFQDLKLRFVSLKIRYLTTVTSPSTVKVFLTIIGGT